MLDGDLDPCRLDGITSLLEQLYLIPRKGLVRDIRKGKVREHALKLHIGECGNLLCRFRRILRVDADTPHARLDRQVNLDRLCLTHSLLRERLHEIHAADRLRDIAVDDLTRTLRLDESEDEQRCCKSCRTQFECLGERRDRQIVRALIECYACNGSRSMPIGIRLDHGAELCALCDT